MEQITIDLIPNGKMPMLHASQYDDGRQVRINLTENRQAYTLTGNEVLSLAVRKADNTLVTMDIANTFGGKSYVEFATTEQMCACAGMGYGELRIKEADKDIGTLNFTMWVEQSPEEGGVRSDSEINNLARQVEELVEEDMGDYLSKDEAADTYATIRDLNTLSGVVDTKASAEEVENIRIGIDGTTYTSAGDAVRGQISDLKNVVDSISTTGKNLFDKDHANVIDAVPDGGTSKYKSSSYGKTVWIKCKPNTTYTASKIFTSRFAIAYGEEEPAVGATLDNLTSNASRTALTITTNGTAKYLSVYLYYSSLDTEKTLSEVLATLQVEVGSEATQYEPFEIIAKDSEAREEIEEINNTLDNYEKQVTVNSTRQNASYGSELIDDFSSLTAIGSSTYADNKWTIPNDSGISTSINVEANKTYLIQLDVYSSTTTDDSGNHKVNPLLISLGDDDIEIFANPDANWKVCLTPTTGGSVTFAIECEEALSIVLSGVSVKPIILFPTAPIIANGKTLFATNTSGYSFAFGGGQAKRANGTMNTAFGYDSQKELDTGYADTAFGHNAQRDIRNGRGNCAFGHRAQEAITTGMYNNAVGTVAQGAITSGCWNNALGNEAQRDITTGCDNTSIGRRAHSYITTGNLNTAVGSQAGFATKTHQDGSWATKTANYQTLIGAEACQNSATQSDYLTALGYRAVGGEKALALGANSSANGVKSVAIGYGVTAENDGDVVIGDADSNIFLGDKELGVDIYTAEQVDAIVTNAIDSVLPTDSVSGAVANFTTSLELPIKSLEVDVNAVQESGTPTPSSPKAISGWSAITLDVNGNTEVITLGDTYYGGYVTQDKAGHRQLVVTKTRVDLGSLSWTQNAQGFYQANKTDEMLRYISTETPEWIAERYQKATGQWIYGHGSTIGYIGANGGLIYCTDSTTPSGYLVAPLTEPIIIDLPDGEPIITLNGTNNIYADTGDTSVVFKCSVNDYINAHSGGGLRSLGNSNENLSKGGGSSEEEPKEDEKEPIEPISKK